jgi:hypothetical protein
MSREKAATHAHVEGLIAELRAKSDQLEHAKADQLEQVKKEGNLYKMALASMEVQSCCGDCIAVTCVPCCGCIQVTYGL